MIDTAKDRTIALGSVEEGTDLVGGHRTVQPIGMIAHELIVVEGHLQHPVVGGRGTEKAPCSALAADGFEMIAADNAVTADKREARQEEGKPIVGIERLLQEHLV